MKALIIGAAGFIGSHLSDLLLQRGHSVIAVDDLSKGRLSNIEHNLASARFEFCRRDARDAGELTVLGRGCDVVVNLAGRKIPRYESGLDTGYEDPRRRVPDLTKSRALLGFEPTVPLREGLRRLWDWYRSPAGAAGAALARAAQ